MNFHSFSASLSSLERALLLSAAVWDSWALASPGFQWVGYMILKQDGKSMFDMQIYFAITPNSAFHGLLEEFFFSIPKTQNTQHISNQFVRKILTFPDSPYIMRHLPTSLRSVGNFLYPPHRREYEDCKQILKLSLNPTHT